MVKDLPDLSNIKKDIYDRYYLYNKNSIVIRVQKINEDFELERKVNESDLVRDGTTIKITKDEFDVLKLYSQQHIQRESYQLQENPRIVLRVYHGEYEGLIRAEVNFSSEDDANSFESLDWFDREITGNPLAQDGYLLQLSKEEFQKLLA